MKSYKAIAIDEFCLYSMSGADIDESWFPSFPSPVGDQIIRAESNECIYFLSPRAHARSRFLVFDLEFDGHGFFGAAQSKATLFERSLLVALSYFDKSISVPLKWRKYTLASRLSIFGQIMADQMGRQLRAYYERGYYGTEHIYAYATGYGADDLRLVLPEASNFLTCVDGIDVAIEEKQKIQVAKNKDEAGGGFAISLGRQALMKERPAGDLDHWLAAKLTSEQRDFVSKSYDGPVRLRGSAGTGKTLSLAIKALVDQKKFHNQKREWRFGFLTHSWSTARLVGEIFDHFDPGQGWLRSEYCSVKLCSIYELAQELLNYDVKSLNPLSTDGSEGRLLQAEIIGSIIDDLRRNPKWRISHVSKCSPEFRAMALEEKERGRFIAELMNEFACVLDAENIRLGTKAADRYLDQKREKWQMNLPLREDRDAVLYIHETYRTALRDMDVLSLDQMISDLNAYMITHTWERLRADLGFDAIFVDELHLFTRPERMVLHNLVRNPAANGHLPIFMAYDMKQSPFDTFLDSTQAKVSGSISLGPVGRSDLVELKKVFRYTPEITAFLRDIDASFPALDLEGEWQIFNADSAREKTGRIPKLYEFSKNEEMIDRTFQMAAADAKEVGGSDVAVLCLNDELFARYASAGRIKDKMVPILSRDQIPGIRYSPRRVVFSMPDYVAGLQFERVYIINLDRADDIEAETSEGALRRLVSRVYLGASRAKSCLSIVSSQERGGFSRILNGAVQSGSLIR